jgi:hypothetical protein
MATRRYYFAMAGGQPAQMTEAEIRARLATDPAARDATVWVPGWPAWRRAVEVLPPRARQPIRAMPVAAIISTVLAVAGWGVAVHQYRAKLHVQGAYGAEMARQLSTVHGDLAATESSLTEVEAELATARARIAELTESPRHVYDQGVALASAGTDEGDEAAIKKFQEVSERWPDDALAAHAREQVEKLRQRVRDRADAVKAKQARVRKLIATCRSASRRMDEIQKEHLRFHGPDNRIDLNEVMAGGDESEPHRQRALKAQAEAEKLLDDGVPDRDGKLRDEVRDCMFSGP